MDPCPGEGHRPICDLPCDLRFLNAALPAFPALDLAFSCPSSLVTRHCSCDWRFTKSANWFIFSPDTADSRYAEVHLRGFVIGAARRVVSLSSRDGSRPAHLSAPNLESRFPLLTPGT